MPELGDEPALSITIDSEERICRKPYLKCEIS